jgi:hypothetical protein
MAVGEKGRLIIPPVVVKRIEDFSHEQACLAANNVAGYHLSATAVGTGYLVNNFQGIYVLVWVRWCFRRRVCKAKATGSAVTLPEVRDSGAAKWSLIPRSKWRRWNVLLDLEYGAGGVR